MTSPVAESSKRLVDMEFRPGELPLAESVKTVFIHEATESWGPDSGFGHLLTYLLVILPLGWVVFKTLTSSFKTPKGPSVPQHSSAR